MNFLRLTCPGKVFILGEYAVLAGGSALVVATAPQFAITATKGSLSGSLNGYLTPDSLENRQSQLFAPESPAGRWLSERLEKEPDLLKDWQMLWKDPYKTPIGVGSSSAQFILARGLTQQPPELESVLKDYWRIVGSTQGLRPSGADVAVQLVGGAIHYTAPTYRSLCRWPQNSDSNFLLAFTGSKMRTHEHLQELQKKEFPEKFSIHIQALNQLTLYGIDYWESGDARGLGQIMNAYQAALAGALALHSQGFLEYQKKISALRSLPGVYGCKGSGAQGGDCILLLVDHHEMASVKQRVIDHGCEPIDLEFSQDGLKTSTTF